MDKRFIIGGLMFWAGVSGYMGLRVLESYTEDAVFAVLSVVPATAKEIRYHFLTDDLRITGIEYEIPHDTVVHRGTIDSVEISKFHRKIMYVKPDMPAYHADELPRVGESFKIRGIADRVHEGHSVLETKIASVDMQNWYQRVGLVLDHFARKGVGEAFFEELFRMRVDEFSASQIEMTLTDPDLGAPVTFRADQFSMPGGIPAPRGEEKTTPVNMLFDRASLVQGERGVSAGRVELRALRAPEPDKLARLYELSKALREGKADAASEGLLCSLDTIWDKYPPVGYAGAQNISVKTGKGAEPVTASSASYSLSRNGDTWTDSMKCGGLLLKPGLFEGMEETVKRFAPEGLKLDIASDSTSDSTSVHSEGSYAVSGLGTLKTSSSLEGEFGKLRKLCLSTDIEQLDPFALAYGLKVQNLKVSYADSGLLPLILSAIAANVEMPPAVLAQEASTVAFGMATDGNAMLRKLGTALGQQLLTPGELDIEFAPEKGMTVKEFTDRLLTDPASLPLKVSSKPGNKPMQEYFLEK
ncbi:MAG: hypothetical protein IJB53_01465 [Mailhella sp.]|nr:hypothetical protein [Mailhella sp.]